MDEVAARGALASMQERLGRGPHAVLGIPTTATSSDIRSAFLSLTKLYHPARFGRLSSETQRLANEIFLGIKGAHDMLSTAAVQTRGGTSPGFPALRPTGQMPPLRPTSVGMPPLQRTPGSPDKTPAPTITRPTGQMPPVRPPTGAVPVQTGSAGTPRQQMKTDSTRPLPTIAVQRAVEAGPPTRPSPDPTLKPVPPRRVTPPMGIPQTVAPRPSQPTRPGATPGSPSTTDKSFPRIDTQPGHSLRAPRTDRLDHRLDPSTTKPPAPSVAVLLELLHNRQWDAAKVALQALSAMAPDSQHVRALVCFASGRQAQIEQRLDEARVDLQRALQLDPDLGPAKAALAELFVRRK